MMKTVKIVKGDGYRIINEIDLDPATDVIYGAAKPLPSREDIAAMGKTDVRGWIEAHGATIPKGRSLPQMREDLVALMFVDLGNDADS